MVYNKNYYGMIRQCITLNSSTRRNNNECNIINISDDISKTPKKYGHHTSWNHHKLVYFHLKLAFKDVPQPLHPTLLQLQITSAANPDSPELSRSIPKHIWRFSHLYVTLVPQHKHTSHHLYVSWVCQGADTKTTLNVQEMY